MELAYAARNLLRSPRSQLDFCARCIVVMECSCSHDFWNGIFFLMKLNWSDDGRTMDVVPRACGASHLSYLRISMKCERKTGCSEPKMKLKCLRNVCEAVQRDFNAMPVLTNGRRARARLNGFLSFHFTTRSHRNGFACRERKSDKNIVCPSGTHISHYETPKPP